MVLLQHHREIRRSICSNRFAFFFSSFAYTCSRNNPGKKERGDTAGVGPNTYADVGEYMRHCFDSGEEYAYLGYLFNGEIHWKYMREGVDYEFKPLFIDALKAHKAYLTRIIEHHEAAAA